MIVGDWMSDDEVKNIECFWEISTPNTEIIFHEFWIWILFLLQVFKVVCTLPVYFFRVLFIPIPSRVFMVMPGFVSSIRDSN